MSDFFRDLGLNPLLLPGLLGGALAGLACGLIGPYLVVRRMVFLTGAIAHMVVGGIGATLFLRHYLGWTGLPPLAGALASALASSLLIGFLQHSARERMDTLIGALWAVGMATGIMLVKFTPGYHAELFSYLFGNVALVDWSDVWLLLILCVIVAGVLAVFHKKLYALCLDEDHLFLQGSSVVGANLLLLALASLTVVALTRLVGLILILAMITLPAAAAGCLTSRLLPMMGLSAVFCILLATLPRIAVYGSPLAPEAAIVLSAAALYLAVTIAKAFWDGRLGRTRKTPPSPGRPRPPSPMS